MLQSYLQSTVLNHKIGFPEVDLDANKPRQALIRFQLGIGLLLQVSRKLHMQLVSSRRGSKMSAPQCTLYTQK
jgi:hypothetical protein